MRHYYTRTFAGMAVVFTVIAIAAVVANSAATDAKTHYQRVVDDDRSGSEIRSAQREKMVSLRQAIEPAREFSNAWKSVARLPEKEAAERVRSDIEAIAQRQLGLVTDSAITPQPDRFLFQGMPLRAQRVTLRASGRDLVALLTWLGKVEERYPAALVESCDFSSNVGGNTGLTIRLVQLLQESGPRHAIVPLQESSFAPESINAISWLSYLPQKVKSPVAVGFARNPLQPAVAGEPRPVPALRDMSDEITPRLEMSLDGRLRSVIRGNSPIIVVDGRVFHPGDEIVFGTSRERPVPEAKTKLKEIRPDHLVFHVAGGTADKPIQCDVTYALPTFLKAQ
jgi:hypothetical protein